jgi:thiol-disulfide isomerase/thioredoxin
MPLAILTQIYTVQDFKNCLLNNPGVFIMKLGADWCGPCRQIESLVVNFMKQAPDNVQCAIVNVDEAAELYSFLKNKRMVSGIPAILAYYKGNLNYIPDANVIGADPQQILNLFQMCYNAAAKQSQ